MMAPAAQQYVSSAEAYLAEQEQRLQELDARPDTPNGEAEREKLEKGRQALIEQLHHFEGEIDFGLGRIWRESIQETGPFLYEFFGALLMGVAVSIGAPYWHDLLRAVSRLRSPTAAGG